MEDCPICKMILDKNILQEEGECCLISWRDEPTIDKLAPLRHVVVSKEHKSISLETNWLEICSLLEVNSNRGVVSVFDIYPGHEGVMLVPSENVKFGKSGQYNE